MYILGRLLWSFKYKYVCTIYLAKNNLKSHKTFGITINLVLDGLHKKREAN